jgi:Tol biopolymer transport system component
VPHFITIDVSDGKAIESTVDRSVLDGFVTQRIWRANTIESLAWDRAGRSIYFIGMSVGSHNVFAVDVDPVTLAITGGPRRLTTTAETNEGVSVSRDGKRIVTGAANRNARVWVYTLDSSGRHIAHSDPISDEKLFASVPDLTRDGQKLLFVKRRLGSGTDRTELWERLLGSSARERLLLTNEGALRQSRSHPRWSADGKSIAYQYMRPGPGGTPIRSLILLNTATLKEAQLTTPVPADRGQEVAYGWSPDHRFIVSSTDRFTPGELVIALFPVSAAPTAEKGAQIITRGTEYYLWNTDMSPDRKWICFQAQKKSISRLAVVRADQGRTSAWVWLTADDVWIDKPRWSTDGRIIYYISRRGGIFNVWGLGFDSARGAAVGEPFQVTQFDGTIDQIPPDVGIVELGVSEHRLAIPVIHPTGGIWMLEQSKQ